MNPNGSKLFPTKAEEAMRLCGTQEGYNKYHTLLGDDLMKVLGYPKFKFTEFLSAQQLKAYMSKAGTDLRKQLEVCKEKIGGGSSNCFDGRSYHGLGYTEL